MTKDAATDVVGDFFTTQVGAVVGSSDGGLEPFPKVVAEFMMLHILGALEQTRPRETYNDLKQRMCDSVLGLSIDNEVRSPSQSSGDSDATTRSAAQRIKAGFGSLRQRANAAVRTKPKRAITVFVTGANGEYVEVAVLDLLARCGVQKASGEQYSSPECDVAQFGWCEADEHHIKMRGLRVVRQQQQAASPALGLRGAASDLAQQAAVKRLVRRELLKSSSTSSASTTEAPARRPLAPLHVERSMHFRKVSRQQADKNLLATRASNAVFLVRPGSGGFVLSMRMANAQYVVHSQLGVDQNGISVKSGGRDLQTPDLESLLKLVIDLARASATHVDHPLRFLRFL